MTNLTTSPTASTPLPDLKRMFVDDKRADGKVWYKPPWDVRGRWKPFQTWIKYLKLNRETCRDRYYQKGWSVKRTFDTPIKTRKPKK